MKCPGCDRNCISVRQRLWIAARSEVRCPACGVAIGLGQRPRRVQSLLGEGVLLLGLVGAFAWQAPILVVLATGSWLSFALLLPTRADPPQEAGDPHE